MCGRQLGTPPALCTCLATRAVVALWSAWAAVTDDHTGGLKQQTLLSHRSRGWQSQIKVGVGVVSLEALLLGHKASIFSQCVHTVGPPCMSTSGSKSPFYSDISHVG